MEGSLGFKINPFLDPWISRPLSCQVVTRASWDIVSVKDLINGYGGWNHTMIDRNFLHVDSEIIKLFPLVE